MSRYFRYADGKAWEAERNGCTAHDPAREFLWIHIDGVADDVDSILDEFTHIPHQAIAALKAHETRPRCTEFGEGALINMRGLGAPSAIDGDPLVSIRFWAERGLTITLSFRELGALERVVTHMLAGEVKDPGDLISITAMEIAEELDPVIADQGDAMDSIESDVLEEEQTGERRKVAQLRAEAISYRRFLSPQRQATERLMALNADWIEPDDRLHFQEAADRYARMVEELESVRERAALTHEALTDLRAEHMNKQALILAIVALVFLPLTFITGLLGMNVEGIPFAKEPWAFWGVVAFCAVTGGAMGIWFIATRWLQK